MNQELQQRFAKAGECIEAHIEISKVEAEKTLNRAINFIDACRKISN